MYHVEHYSTVKAPSIETTLHIAKTMLRLLWDKSLNVLSGPAKAYTAVESGFGRNNWKIAQIQLWDACKDIPKKIEAIIAAKSASTKP